MTIYVVLDRIYTNKARAEHEAWLSQKSIPVKEYVVLPPDLEEQLKGIDLTPEQLRKVMEILRE